MIDNINSLKIIFNQIVDLIKQELVGKIIKYEQFDIAILDYNN